MATGGEKLPSVHRAKVSMIDGDGNENYSCLRAGEENIDGTLCNRGREALFGSSEILCLDTVNAVAHRIINSIFFIEIIFVFELLSIKKKVECVRLGNTSKIMVPYLGQGYTKCFGLPWGR